MQWLRLIAVGFAVAFMVGRVAPDMARVFVPLGTFDYATNDDGVVIKAPAKPARGNDPLYVGDRVRIDRIHPFDRKPGLERVAFTRDNFDRRLPIERAGREQIVALKAVPETPANRAIVLLGIALYFIAVSLGGLLLIVKPRIATLGFFIFTLGGNQPTSFTDMLFDVPWREIAPWIGDTVSGAAPFGLLMFAFALAVESHRARVIAAIALGLAALGFGTIHAYDGWRLIYGAERAASLARVYAQAELSCTLLTSLAFAAAFVRARGAERQRTGYIVFVFALAGAGRAISERFYPAHLNFIENSVLVALSIVPIVVVWIAVVKHRFFDVDFVVSRALVYTAITAAVVGIVGSSEEILTYLFYNNTDLAYGLIIGCSLAIGACFGKVKEFLDRFVDRFVFRERRDQRTTLERVAANLLDVEETDTVWTVLLHDIPSILDLSFSGIMTRTPEGGFRLEHQWQWPPECVTALDSDHAFTRRIDKVRGILPPDAARSRMVKALFPNDRLTYAAPLYFDRAVAAIVLYGHSISGLDIDPEERAVLGRAMANASIALSAIELSRYRTALAERRPSIQAQ
jgi:hypothetical protein